MVYNFLLLALRQSYGTASPFSTTTVSFCHTPPLSTDICLTTTVHSHQTQSNAVNICFVIGCAYSRLCDIRTSYRRIDSVLFVFQNSCVCFREIAVDHEKKTVAVLKKKEGWGGGCGGRSGSGNMDMNSQISGCTQRNLYRTR